MADTDDTAGQKKIADVFAIQAAIRYLENTLAVPLVTGRPIAKYPVCRVQVNRPASVGHRVMVLFLFNNICLGKHVQTFKPPAFPFSGYGTYPFERIRFCLWKFA